MGQLQCRKQNSCEFSLGSHTSDWRAALPAPYGQQKRESIHLHAEDTAGLHAVHDPLLKSVNTSGMKCLWFYFRHLQRTIHGGMLSTGKRMQQSLNIPVLRQPDLTQSWGCAEKCTAAKTVKNRPVKRARVVTGFSVHRESTRGRVRSTGNQCLTGEHGFNVTAGPL